MKKLKNVANQGLEFVPIVWSIRIIAISIIAQMYLSLNLWFPIDRSYPRVPTFPFIEFNLGRISTYFFSTLFIGNLIVACLYSKLRVYALATSLFSISILLLEDINRFQAWLYIYLALLGVITWSCWQNKRVQSLVSLQFIMAMVYFWTGAQKLNIQFITYVYPWIMGIFSFTEGLKDYPMLGYLVGWFELTIGTFLLHNKTVRLGVILAVLLHVGILILLVKDEWNTVVYPWNLAMIGLLFVLFWKYSKHNKGTIFSIQKPHLLVLLLFGLVPFLDFFSLVPHQLGLGMYSGTSKECNVIFRDEVAVECIPEKLWEYLLHESETESDLSLDDWAMVDLNIPPFASERVFKKIAKEVCTCTVNHGGFVEFLVPNRWKDDKKVIKMTCTELLAE